MEEQKDVWGRLEAAVEKKLQELGEVNSRLQRKIFDLHAIFEITKQLNSVLELEKLLDAILLVASEQAGSTTAALVITSSNPEELSLWRSRGLDLAENLSPLSSNSYLVETLLRKMRGVTLAELEQILPSNSDEVRFLKDLGLELCFPLVSRDKIIGILFLGSRSSKGRYQAPDLEFLSTLVNNLAVTVENARLYQSIKAANLEVQKAQVQLAEKEKLAALGELAASLAHEINNPLGIIKNYLALLQQESHKNQTTLEYVEIMKEELNRVAKIIQELLNLYQPQKKEEFKPTDVASVLHESIDLLETDLEERQIALERKIDGAAPVISAREEELKQVFLNLLMNSRDFTPPGGKINVSLAQRNGSLEIEFTDSGVGIPESDLKKIFVPFFTTKERGKGTGLGLSICRRIIQDHQGNIEAKNLKGGGASFLIRLPLN
jgi:signal transduction histidine kinase